MAQSLQDIMQQLDAGYSPSRDLINQQIAALPSQSDAQIAGLKAQEDQSYNDITDQARARGMGFSGIPLADQAKYNATTFLPAVANVYTTQNNNKNTLLGALGGLQEDQVKTANQVQAQQVQNDIAQEQANAAARAAAAANGAISGLDFGTSAPSGQAAAPDKFATLGNNGKQQATNAIVGLLMTGNVNTVYNTIKAITDSANRGNLYDQFKLQLLNMYKTSQYGSLLNKAAAYKPAAAVAPARSAGPGSQPGNVNIGGLSLNNPLSLGY